MAIYLSRVVVRFAVSPSQRRRRALVEYFVLRRRDEQSCSRAGSSTRPSRGRARRVTRQPRRCTASGEHTCRGRCVGRRRRRASAAAIARQGEQGLQLARTARLPPARSRAAERALLKRLYRQTTSLVRARLRAPAGCCETHCCESISVSAWIVARRDN